jgi:predicted dehydrogenase
MLNVVVLGAGKWAHECWAQVLGENVDRYTVTGVVDPYLARARSLAETLRIGTNRAHTSLDDALDQNSSPTAAIVLTPPEHHAVCIVELAEAGLHILTEKPLATTTHAAATIADAVNDTGVKLAVVQNYRYQPAIQTARQVLASNDLGTFHYITARFAVDYRKPGSWDMGDAHTMPSPLLGEGAIHHLDMIRYLTGQDIATVTAITTNPPASSFTGDAVAGLLLRLADHGFALYEATLLAAGTENRWRQEHYRVECEHGSLTINGPTLTITQARHTEHMRWPVPHMLDGHRTLIPRFADWITGQGPASDTTLNDNLRTLAVMLAALESSRHQTTTPVLNLNN